MIAAVKLKKRKQYNNFLKLCVKWSWLTLAFKKKAEWMSSKYFMSDDFMVPHCSTNICHFIETNRVNVICLPYLHPSVLVSFPVMAVVSSLTLQRDSSPQHYRPDRRTHCDLQLLWLQGHLDHNHSWTLSIRLYISLSLALSWCMLRAFGINLLLLHIYIFPALSSSRCKLSTWTPLSLSSLDDIHAYICFI